MNDYLLRILIRQRHEAILAEVRANQLSEKRHCRIKRGNRLIDLFRSFFARWKRPLAFEPPGVVERGTSWNG